MRGFGIKTRIVLVGVIGLILLGYGWWFLAPRKAAVPDAEITVTMRRISLTPGHVAEELARLPLFDAVTGGWIVDGKPRRSIIALVPPRDPDPGADPEGYGRWLTVRLADDAGKGVMQAAMRALASEGICRAAIIVAGVDTAPMFVIRNIADGKGGVIPCRDRLNRARR
jgi:hypothetical protein